MLLRCYDNMPLMPLRAAYYFRDTYAELLLAFAAIFHDAAAFRHTPLFIAADTRHHHYAISSYYCLHYCHADVVLRHELRCLLRCRRYATLR